jgi:Spy/CpxP family protein refolding chaperone
VNTWKIILATMVIFATGVVTGGLLVQHIEGRAPHAHRPTTQAPHPGQPASAGVMRLEFLRRAQHELDLTPDQQERIDKIIKDNQDRTRKLIEPVLQRTRQEFMDVLTPEQRTRFQQLVKEQQQRIREQRRQAVQHEHALDTTSGTTNAAAVTNAP